MFLSGQGESRRGKGGKRRGVGGVGNLAEVFQAQSGKSGGFFVGGGTFNAPQRGGTGGGDFLFKPPWAALFGSPFPPTLPKTAVAEKRRMMSEEGETMFLI